MLTKIKIKGFKNLYDCEVAFGPLTCIAGINASGKSNLFDAIMFLRDLSDYSIIEAASRVRDSGLKRATDLRALFTSLPGGIIPDIDIEAEFLVPKIVTDDFGREAYPSTTHLKYRVALRYLPPAGRATERIELIHESLTYVPKGESRKSLGFPHSTEFWNSVIGGARRADFISTENNSGSTVIRLRQEGHQGRPLDIPASNSPRTVLSTINTDDKPTALAARREMQSWRLLQLEPSKLRLPDDFSEEEKVSSEGAHMPAALHRLGKFDQVANRLSELLPDVVSINVDVDEGRRLKTLLVTQRDGAQHTARGLSDGTLRFLALSIISVDSESGGLICLEEPENGIHPTRVKSMMDLLSDMASDPLSPVDEDNPLRQIIINTHSPLVVQTLNKEFLLVSLPIRNNGASTTIFAPISDTWRTRTSPDCKVVPLGVLLSYLTSESEPTTPHESEEGKISVKALIAQQMSLFEER